jgi:hypothetical protein
MKVRNVYHHGSIDHQVCMCGKTSFVCTWPYVQAGVNAAPEAIITSLIRADTAQQFNISMGEASP